jgi:hypothetical protein
MGENGSVPPLSRRVPGASDFPPPPAYIAPPEVPKDVLERVLATLQAERETAARLEQADKPEQASEPHPEAGPAGRNGLKPPAGTSRQEVSAVVAGGWLDSMDETLPFEAVSGHAPGNTDGSAGAAGGGKPRPAEPDRAEPAGEHTEREQADEGHTPPDHAALDTIAGEDTDPLRLTAVPPQPRPQGSDGQRRARRTLPITRVLNVAGFLFIAGCLVYLVFSYSVGPPGSTAGGIRPSTAGTGLSTRDQAAAWVAGLRLFRVIHRCAMRCWRVGFPEPACSR